ncbi:zinc finger protein 879 [Diachasma alloeum]|uniref:zinc finger protein 879 n=1 Tax=Diachasma alloeum TaxID=454923 RepID=UPI00073823B9|nr:zinc finger protein 879 [Diachasma alloeum]
MGSSLLVCPMCCGETFNSSQSLKYHLLSMTDNLYCPGCSQRSESVAALIQHLDACGTGDNVTFEETVNEGKIGEGEVLMDTNVEQIHESFLASVNNEGIMIVGGPRSLEVDDDGQIKMVQKMEPENDPGESILPDDEYEDLENIDEDGSVKSSTSKKDETSENAPVISIPEKTDDTSNENNVIGIYSDETAEYFEGDQSLMEINEDEDTKELGEEFMRIDATALYSCSSCGMGFNSVLDHIKQYHDGQEVVLEMADEAPVLQEEPAEPEGPVTKTKQRQKMNTIKTEECIDSEGRLYTRKVVQIEPFWDKSNNQSDNSKTTSMIEKFFSNAEGVKPRQKPEPPVPKVHRCNQCLEQFPRLTDFRTHVCLNGSNHCDHCDQSFATVKALQVHSKVHEVESNDPDRQFICTTCGTKFASHKSLRLHSRMHAPVRERHVDAPEGDPDATFTCFECGKSFSESYRSAHMALHTGDSVTCTICNRKFDSADSLAMHAAVHPELGMSEPPRNQGRKPWKKVKPPSPSEGPAEGEKEGAEGAKGNDKDNGDLSKPYQCQHCGRRFTRPHEKVKHERIHTGEKPHACEVCGKTFRVSYCLTLHMRTHTGVRPYECKHCGKRFKASSVYNHHLLTHGEERAYKCPFCVKTFKTRVQLAGHKNSHTKPFRCTECSRPFASLYAARAHIATHKKDNNLKFSCYICGASYGRAFALNDHMKVHGSEAVATPEPAREEIIHEDFLLEEDITEQELAEGISPDLQLSENGMIKKFVDSD